MTMHFRYKLQERKNHGNVYAPCIPLTFSGKQKLTSVALIDSGADTPVISRDFAELLELDLRGKKQDVAGIGGTVKGTLSKVSVKIEKGHDRVVFQMPVWVLDDFNNNPLLGREVFFDKFNIKFQQNEKKFILSPTSSRAGR
ncbi:MAG: hypothetical protein GXP63_00600 [DPANN group archaeon]|nr:hypothetical protein [DPANN group archaeon]